jgi:hypothetical protein
MEILRFSGFARLAAATLLACLIHGAAMAEEKRMERTITVSASAEVAAEPDMARLSSGVASEAETAREALARNSSAMAKVIVGLKTAGVEAKDIQTSSFQVEPRYTNPREGQAPVINGYRVSNQVDVRVRDLKRLGEIMDSLVSLGANQVSGLAFEVSQAETLEDEARKLAIANARRRAELFATAAGASVGEVLAISEETAHPGPRPYAMGRVAAMADAVPVEAGSQMLEARVSVTWALK